MEKLRTRPSESLGQLVAPNWKCLRVGLHPFPGILVFCIKLRWIEPLPWRIADDPIETPVAQRLRNRWLPRKEVDAENIFATTRLPFEARILFKSRRLT